MTTMVSADELWKLQGLCTQTDPEVFYPEKGGNNYATRVGKRICRGCEVRAECLEYALTHDERFGVWGGLSERERRRLPPVEGPVVAAFREDYIAMRAAGLAEWQIAKRLGITNNSLLRQLNRHGITPRLEFVSMCVEDLKRRRRDEH